MGPGGRPEARRATGATQKCCLFGVRSWWWQKSWTISKKNGFWAKKLHFWPEILHFFMLHLWNPPFLARTVPTQWDDNSSISWGNSGYLWFSGRWPFGHSAGRFMAPIAQSGPSGVQKCCFLARTHIFVVSFKINCYDHNGTHKRQLWLYTLTCHNISKRFAAGCYFEWAPTNLVDFL